MPRPLRSLALSIPLLAACYAAATVRVTERADFVSGAGTNGWTVTSGRWISPTFADTVLSVTAVCTNPVPGSALLVETGVGNVFTVTAQNGGALSAFAVERLDPHLATPENLFVTNLTTSSFRLDWSSVADAVGYRVTVSSNRIVGASAGTPCLEETFSYVFGMKSSTELTSANLNAFADNRGLGWLCNKVYHGEDAGVIRLGNSSEFGAISFPFSTDAMQVTDGRGLALKLRVARVAGTGSALPVDIVTSAGVTNAVGSVLTSLEPTDLILPLPDLEDGDRIVIHSVTNNKASARVLLDTVTLLKGYDPGAAERVAYLTANVRDVTSFETNGLDAVASWVTVQALHADSAWNSALSAEAFLPLDNPPRMPILKALDLSTLSTKYVYQESFLSLAEITQKTDWYNGVWPLAYWMATTEDGANVTSIARASANSSTSRLYSFASTNGTLVALGLQANSDTAVCCGLAFHNDTAVTFGDVQAVYTAVQWRTADKIEANQTLFAECLVTNALVSVGAPGAWRRVASLAFSSEDADVVSEGDCVTAVRTCDDLPCGAVSPGEWLLVRFVAERGANRAGFGLANFRIAFSSGAGFSLMLK